MNYEVMACILPENVGKASIIGQVCLIDEQVVELDSRSVPNYIRLGIRGTASGSVVFDERCVVKAGPLCKGVPRDFAFSLPRSLLHACDTVVIALVDEGVQWLLAEQCDSLFALCIDGRCSEQWFRPRRDIEAAHFARRLDESKTLLVVNYLAALRSKFDNAVAVDFCWQYYLDRAADGIAMQNAIGSLSGEERAIGHLAVDVSQSDERSRLAATGSRLPDPYRFLGVWL